MAEMSLVLTVALIGWAGIFLYLVRLDLRLRELERKQ